MKDLVIASTCVVLSIAVTISIAVIERLPTWQPSYPEHYNRYFCVSAQDGSLYAWTRFYAYSIGMLPTSVDDNRGLDWHRCGEKELQKIKDAKNGGG